jgi:hypothetical protein
VHNLHANLPMVVGRFRLLPPLMPCLTCPKSRLYGFLPFMITGPTAAASHRVPNFREFPFRDCPKRGTSNPRSVDLGGVGMPKWAEKYGFGGP